MTQRELTVYHLAKHSPFMPSEITKLLRLAASHRRLCEMKCNGEGSADMPGYLLGPGQVARRVWSERDETKRERIEGRIAQIIKVARDRSWTPSGHHPPMPLLQAIFSYDPRGATVKIAVPDGFTDDWGREGICL